MTMAIGKVLPAAIFGAALFLGAIVAGNPAGAASRGQVKDIIVEAADRTIVPPSLALAVAHVESNFRDDYESPTGARGVMQIMPDVAEQDYDVDPDELWDARANVRLGLRILEDLIRDADHGWDVALARYAVGSKHGSGRGRTRNPVPRFVGDVLRWERRYAEEITAQNDVERRRREVLRVANDGRYYVDPDDDKSDDLEHPRRTKPRRYYGRYNRRYDRYAWRDRDHDLHGDIEARRRAARRWLDDFGSGRIPDNMPRRRGRWEDRR